jgi:hypothetical protein
MSKNTLGLVSTGERLPSSVAVGDSLERWIIEISEQPKPIRRLETIRHLVADKIERTLWEAAGAFGNEIPLIAPRSEIERANQFDVWLTEYQTRFLQHLAALLSKEFDSVLEASIDWNVEAERLAARLWPMLSENLRQFGIRAIGTRWAARQYPDGVGVYEPEPADYGWRLPLRLFDTGNEIGQIALDKDGNVLRDHTTAPDSLRESLRRAE